jgi:hypothetical protein
MCTFAALALTEICRRRKRRPQVGIAAFLFLLLLPAYALEGYWTARVRGRFETLVTSGFRFGNEDLRPELAHEAYQECALLSASSVDGFVAFPGLRIETWGTPGFFIVQHSETRHKHITGNHKAISKTHRFKHIFKYAVHCCGVQKRLPAITTEGEKVKTSAFLVADQSVGHDGGIVKPVAG